LLTPVVPAEPAGLIVAWETFRERIINSRELGVDKNERKKTMKILRIPLVIVMLVLAGRVLNAGAQTETNLYSFGSFANDGAYPQAGLVQGSDGNFYGTASGGGTSNAGTVFRISPSGNETNLHSFAGSPDGLEPAAVLIQGSDGNFYGTTEYGGMRNNGTVFRISTTGSYSNLYLFGSVANDGANPFAGLVQGSDGNFYGTTDLGGTNYDGTVFRISPSGNETNLWSFGDANDGAYPQAGLVQGSDGNFYGTTQQGGTNGYGTVFRISPSGNETNLYSFGSSPTDGQYPAAGLVQGSDGNFYGTTDYGGMNDVPDGGDGTVFRISPSGSYTNLYSFGSFANDGAYPQAGLVQGSDGNFYGTTDYGGGTNLNNGNGFGTVFRINPSGSETILHSFAGEPTDGQQPFAGLVQGSDGNFYGTTYQGATTNFNIFDDLGYGTVFKLTVPLSPPPYPINQITGVHLAATNIIFNIPSIAGETYQLQFSSSMTPTNWVDIPVSVTNSIGALLTLTNFGGAIGPQGFYRFDITP
jgi:uncharacterized repeat protein (TIGR03803 family)